MSHQRASLLTKLQTLPREPLFDVHVWVDYVELLCLFGDDREITKADVKAHYRRRKDLGEGPPLSATDAGIDIEGSLSIDDGYGDAETIADDDDGSSASGTGEFAAAERADKLELRIDTWFRHLPYRIKAFGDAYPFLITKNHDALRVRKPLTQRQKLYLLFLLSSHLNYFAEHSTTFTSGFEAISLEALKKL